MIGKEPMGRVTKNSDQLFMRALHSMMANAGFDEVTIMHGWIMGYLYHNRENTIYQKDIENKFMISKSTVTNILKLMEKKGYITRCEAEHDARLKSIELTELGIKKHLETISVLENFNEALEAGITEQEKADFMAIMDKLRNNAKKILEEDK